MNEPNEVIPNVWIASWVGAQKKSSSGPAGIAFVTAASDSPWVGHVKFDLVDGPGNDPEVYRAAVDYVVARLTEGVPVVVNCVGGRSRSAAVLCSAIAKHQKTDFNAAYSLVKKARDIVGIHPALYDLHLKTT